MEAETSLSSANDPTPASNLLHRATHHSSGLRHEHGHSLRRIQPMSRHSGESVSTFFNGLFTTIIGISTLGASITFSYVISNNSPPPATHMFAQTEVQLFLSISWLLFLLALAFSSLFSTLLTFFKAHWKADWDCENGVESRVSVQVYAAFSTFLMGTLVIAAFIFLCLVVIAYSPVIGWIALGFTVVFGIIIVGSVVYQAPWPWRAQPVDPTKRASA